MSSESFGTADPNRIYCLSVTAQNDCMQMERDLVCCLFEMCRFGFIRFEYRKEERSNSRSAMIELQFGLSAK